MKALDFETRLGLTNTLLIRWYRFAERVHKLRPAAGNIALVNGMPVEHMIQREFDDAIAAFNHALREGLPNDRLLQSVQRKRTTHSLSLKALERVVA